MLDTALEVIDLRSFSNLWYWIALAVLWSSVSHWVLGVPHDMIQRARKEGGQAQQDVEDLVRININRLLHVVDSGALFLVGIAGFWLSSLAVLAFYYDVEFAQAVFFLMAPMMLVLWVSVRAGRQIAAGENTGEALFRRLTIHRRVVQVIGMLAIAVTAFYGTWQNVSASILY
ncbi:component of SufBCD complex [Tabrizicola sp.]|uniref:component of SufBCD complex n=1 Tax=Tabrizicola sp. TaxID=2005166 RepID=UPI003F396D91